MRPRRPTCTTRLVAATLAWSAAAAPAGVVEAERQPPLASDAEPAIISGPTTFNLGLSSTAGLRVAWPHAAPGVSLDDVGLPASAVPEPASASLALAGLAVLGALLARRRCEV